MVIFIHSLAKRIAALAAALVVMTAAVSAAEVEAQLDREVVPAGNGAILTLKISGARAARPVMPEMADFIFQPRGQSQQMQIVNGQTSSSVTYSYAVGSNTPGDFPDIHMLASGTRQLDG